MVFVKVLDPKTRALCETGLAGSPSAEQKERPCRGAGPSADAGNRKAAVPFYRRLLVVAGCDAGVTPLLPRR